MAAQDAEGIGHRLPSSVRWYGFPYGRQVHELVVCLGSGEGGQWPRHNVRRVGRVLDPAFGADLDRVLKPGRETDDRDPSAKAGGQVMEYVEIVGAVDEQPAWSGGLQVVL